MRNKITNTDKEDKLYKKAVEIIKDYDCASLSLLKRKLRTDWVRASVILELLEKNSIIGPTGEHLEPRRVLIK